MSDDVVLAERKRRKKWTLNPRGKFWTDDNDKLGQKMLEKMGWSKGKGLGAKEQGMSDPILVHGNNESKGLGFQGNPDQWLNHQEDFDDILASLNASNPPEKNKKPTSLEERSKSSRSRVHYHKFTRGKDLSNWKESDLACIFGKKSSRRKHSTSTKEATATENAKQQAIEAAEEEEIGAVSNQHGVTVIKGGSMADYFAKKLKSVGSSSISTTEAADDASSDERPSFFGGNTGRAGFGANSWVTGGFQGSTDGKETGKSSGEKNLREVCDNYSDTDKRAAFSDGVTGTAGFEGNLRLSGGFQKETGGEASTKRVKKSKKKKGLEKYVAQEGHVLDSCTSPESSKRLDEDTYTKLTKGMKKRKHETTDELLENNENFDDDIVVKKKKSKKKKKCKSEEPLRLEESVSCDEGNEFEELQEVKKKKKKKKKRRKEFEEDLDGQDLEPKRKKEKKKVEEDELHVEAGHRKEEKRKGRFIPSSDDYQWQQCSKQIVNQTPANPPNSVETC